MADFKISFVRGLEAAAEASARIEEINSVFEDLNSQLSDASDGRVKILRKSRYVNPLNGSISATFNISNFLNREEETYIVATNPLSPQGPEEDLALWEMDSRGYPCKVSFGGRNFYCEDRAGLEDVLAQLLAWPDAGKMFQRLISAPIPS